ncbi:hypothetical protein JW926_09090 [Candidatus Sumerlaeota bacterium]|nr:hypothetical protein [Candidatus Sumerlaeota bacterium]
METNPGRKFPLFLVFAILAFSIASCACFNENNRRSLNVTDEWIHPRKTAAQIALAPPAVTLGTVALASDIALVHPAVMVPRAADDVYELYWKPRGRNMFHKALLIIPCVILTPPTFVGDWLGRSLFDVNK